jgi:protein-tyrosine phosphatase
VKILFVCLGNIGRSPTVEGVARQLTAADSRHFDLLLAMDEANLAAMRKLAPAGCAERAQLFLSYAPAVAQSAVPDPYYCGPAGFETVLDLAEHGSRSLFVAVAAILGHRADAGRS